MYASSILKSFFALLALEIIKIDGEIYEAKTEEELQNYIDQAQPGDIIKLTPNKTFIGPFDILWLGEPNITQSKISIEGTLGNILTINETADPDENYVLKIESSADWRLFGFTIQNAERGVLIQNCSRIFLENLTIQNIEKFGVEVLNSFDAFTIANSTVRDIGSEVFPGVGILVYDNEKSEFHSETFFNDILDNKFGPGITGTAIRFDMVFHGWLIGNSFNGTGWKNWPSEESARDFGCFLTSNAETNFVSANNAHFCEGNGFVIKAPIMTDLQLNLIPDSTAHSDPNCKNTFKFNYCNLKINEDKGSDDEGSFCIVVPESCHNLVYNNNRIEGSGNLTNVDLYVV